MVFPLDSALPSPLEAEASDDVRVGLGVSEIFDAG